MEEWMSSPEAGTTHGKKMTPKTARVETKTKDPQGTTVCLVDLPHSLLVLVLRWVEALTYPDNDEVSGLVATFLGCESLCSALQSAVKDDAVWRGLSRRYQIRKVQPPSSPKSLKEGPLTPLSWSPSPGTTGAATLPRGRGSRANAVDGSLRPLQANGVGLRIVPRPLPGSPLPARDQGRAEAGRSDVP